MKRVQILLSPELDGEIKKIARNQEISQSKVVRELLNRALAMKSRDDTFTKSSKPTSYGTKLLSLTTFTTKNPRIDGFREIFSVGGKTTEIKILPHSVFKYYKRHKRLPKKLKYQILKIADQLRELSETKRLAVRRAYVVPRLENPPGPRFVGLTPKEVIDAIRRIYDFAIEHEYDTRKGSQICIFFYPFVDPKPLSVPVKRGATLPYGGYAAPLNKRASRVEVFAVWGNNEGVQSFDAIDRYIVDTERKIILKKSIPQKTLMLCTTRKSQSNKIKAPQDKQFEQVLSDSEILEVGRIVRELTQKYGLRRVEFSFDGVDSIVFNESVPYEIYEKKFEDIDKKGVVTAISSENDVEKLRRMKDEEVEKTIVYIDRSIVQKRAYDILNSVAGLPKKFTVLYPGLSVTAHAMRVLNDFGHTAIVVGNRVFKEGEELIVRARDNQINIDHVSKVNMRNMVANLHDAKLFGREIVGGKAFNLSTLKSKGFKVPHGLVLTTEFFDKVVSQEKGEAKVEIPRKLWGKIVKAASFEPGKKYAVRSSADVEDQTEHAFAGQFKSFLNVEKNEIQARVSDVVKSAFDPRVKKYLSALDKPHSVKMAVVIQEMIDAGKSGVIFGKDVQTSNEDLVVIDVARGLGEGVVEGTAETQRVVYSRSKDALIKENAGRTKKILSRIEIDSLVEMALSVENLMEESQDIEWSIDKGGDIWLIQTRGLG